MSRACDRGKGLHGVTALYPSISPSFHPYISPAPVYLIDLFYISITSIISTLLPGAALSDGIWQDVIIGQWG